MLSLSIQPLNSWNRLVTSLRSNDAPKLREMVVSKLVSFWTFRRPADVVFFCNSVICAANPVSSIFKLAKLLSSDAMASFKGA